MIKKWNAGKSYLISLRCLLFKNLVFVGSFWSDHHVMTWIVLISILVLVSNTRLKERNSCSRLKSEKGFSSNTGSRAADWCECILRLKSSVLHCEQSCPLAECKSWRMVFSPIWGLINCFGVRSPAFAALLARYATCNLQPPASTLLRSFHSADPDTVQPYFCTRPWTAMEIYDSDIKILSIDIGRHRKYHIVSTINWTGCNINLSYFKTTIYTDSVVPCSKFEKTQEICKMYSGTDF